MTPCQRVSPERASLSAFCVSEPISGETATFAKRRKPSVPDASHQSRCGSSNDAALAHGGKYRSNSHLAITRSKQPGAMHLAYVRDPDGKQALRASSANRKLVQPAGALRLLPHSAAQPFAGADSHRHGTWPAWPWFLSSASRASHPGARASAQTLSVDGRVDCILRRYTSLAAALHAPETKSQTLLPPDSGMMRR